MSEPRRCVLLGRVSRGERSQDPESLLLRACELLDLDRKTLEADARKQFAAKEKPAKAAKKTATKSAKKGGRK